MTKQELLENPEFYKAKSKALIYFAAYRYGFYRAVILTAPRREEQLRGSLCFNARDKPITKAELLANPIFRHAAPYKQLVVTLSGCDYPLGACDVEIDNEGDVMITEKY